MGIAIGGGNPKRVALCIITSQKYSYGGISGYGQVPELGTRAEIAA